MSHAARVIADERDWDCRPAARAPAALRGEAAADARLGASRLEVARCG